MVNKTDLIIDRFYCVTSGSNAIYINKKGPGVIRILAFLVNRINKSQIFTVSCFTGTWRILKSFLLRSVIPRPGR